MIDNSVKIGDVVIYLWDPHKDYPIVSASVARLTRPYGASMFDKDPSIKPFKNLFGHGGMHEQIAKEHFLYRIGDKDVFRKIFRFGVKE